MNNNINCNFCKVIGIKLYIDQRIVREIRELLETDINEYTNIYEIQQKQC